MLNFYLLLLEEEDRESFRSIYENNYLKMYHVAYSRLKHRENAENAVHDAFLKLAEKFEKYKNLPEDKMSALCCTIVKNASIDIWRKGKHETDFGVEEEILNFGTAVAEESMEKAMETQLFMDRIKVLNEPMRLVLYLKYYHGFKNREIAGILNITPRTVEMRLHRAKKILRETLKDDRERV